MNSIAAIEGTFSSNRKIVAAAAVDQTPVLLAFESGFAGANTIHKTISTTFFLYFACILPAIALGVLNSNNTRNAIS